MTAIKIEKLVPRVVFATPFRLFAIYISLFCAAVAATFIYVTISTQGFLNHEAEAAVNVEYENLAGALPGRRAALARRRDFRAFGLLLRHALSSDRRQRAGGLPEILTPSSPVSGIRKALPNSPIASARTAK